MTLRSWIAGSTVLLCLVAGCSRDLSVPPLQRGEVHGVVDTQGHIPLAGNTVALVASDRSRVTQVTDAQGAFAFSDVPPGLYYVDVSLAGFAPLLLPNVQVLGGQDLDTGTLAPSWLAGTASEGVVSGKIVVSGGGSPSGGQVEFLLKPVNQRVALATIASDGAFVQRVPPGTYDLNVTHPLYVTGSMAGVAVGEGAIVDLTASPISLALNPATLTGTVLEEVDGAAPVPAPGALVTLGNGATTTADAAGRINLQGLPAGELPVRVTLAGFHDPSSRVVSLKPGQTTPLDPVTLMLDRGSVTGTVAIADHQAVSGATVALTGTGYNAVCTPDAQNPWQGTFQISNVPVGSYEVSATKSGYSRAQVGSVAVSANAATAVGQLTLTVLQGDFVIVGDPATPGYTRAPAVTLDLSRFTGAATFRASEDPTFTGVSFAAFTGAQQPFTLGSAEGTHVVYAQYENASGTASPVFSASIVLDDLPPGNGQVAINGGAGFTRVANPLFLTLQADESLPPGADTVSGLAEVRINETGALSGGLLVATAQPYRRDLSYTRTSSADGVQPLYVQFVDHAGNASAVVTASIVVDTVAPAGGLTIGDGAGSTLPGYTRSPLVTLNQSSSAEPNGGFVLVKLANSQAALATAVLQPVSAASAWFLDASGDGTKTVYGILQDAAGNTSALLSASIAYDTLAPSPVSATLLSPATTRVASATLSLSATDASPLSPTQAVTASEDPLLQTGLIGPAAMPGTGQLIVPLSNGDGLKRVYVRFRDAAGNDATTSVLVTLKQAPPSATLALQGQLADGTVSSAVTSTPSIDAVIATSGGASGYLLGNETLTSCPAAGYTALGSSTVTVPFSLSGAATPRQVRLCVTDAAGNRTGPITQTISLDGADPVGCAIGLTGTRVDGSAAPAGKTGSAAVTLALTGCSETPVEMVFTNGTVSCSPSAPLAWVPYSASSAFLLTGHDGLNTVNGCVRDAAHRTSAATAGTITLKTTPPSAPQLTLDSGALYVNAAQVGTRGGNIATAAGSANGALEWALSESDPSAATFQPLASTSPQEFAFAGTGPRTLRAIFRDDVGNLSAVASASITFDVTPPSIAGSSLAIVSPVGTGATNSVSATVQLTAPADATQMQVVNAASPGACADTDFAGAVGEPVVSQRVFLLAAGDGLKGVCARFLDAAGNLSGILSNTITLDTSAPSAPTILSPASGYTNLQTVAVNIAASIDPPPVSSPVTYECLGGQFPDWTACGSAATTSFSFALPANAESVLSVRARDPAGNASSAASIHLTSLPFPPAPPAITRVKASGSSIALNWSTSAGAVRYLVDYGLSATSTSGVGAVEGPSPVSAGPATNLQLTGLPSSTSYYVSVQAVDAAGNVSDPGAPVLVRTQNVTPRVLSVWGSNFATLGVNQSTTSPKGYLVQDQGLVQLDLSSDSATTVTGRATMPGVRPLNLPTPVQSCRYAPSGQGLVNGDCVLVPTSNAVYVYFFDTTTANPMTVGIPVASISVAGINGGPTGVAVSGHLLFVTTFRQLEVFDITDPAQPQRLVVQSLNALDTVYGLGVVGSTLYVTFYSTAFPSELQMMGFDVSNPRTGSLPVVARGDVSMQGAFPPAYTVAPQAAYTANGVYLLYQLSGREYLAAYGTPTGTAPGTVFAESSVLTMDTTGWSYPALVATNAHLYAFSGSGAYSVPTSLATKTVIPGATYETAAVAYTKAGVDHLAVVNYNLVQRWSDTPITQLPTTYSEPSPDLIFAYDDYVVGVTVSSGAYRTLDVSNPLATTLAQTGVLHSASYLTGTVRGRTLYLAPKFAGGGVELYRINTDGSLTYLATAGAGTDQVSALAVSGSLLYVGQDPGVAGVKIYNVSNPAAPTLVPVTTGAVTEKVSALAVRNRTVYVIDRSGLFHVYTYSPAGSGTWTSVTSATPPASLLGQTSYGDWAQWLTVAGDVAAVSSISKTFVVRLTATTATYDPAVFRVGGQTLLEGGYVVGNQSYLPGISAYTSSDGLSFDLLSQDGREGSPDGTVPATGCNIAAGARTLAQSHGVYVQACPSSSFGVQVMTAADPQGGHLIQQYAGNWADTTPENRPLATDGMFNFTGANSLGSSGALSNWSQSVEGLAAGMLGLPVQNTVSPGPALFGIPRFATVRDGTLFLFEDLGGTPYVGTYDVSNPQALSWPYIGWTSLPGISSAYGVPPVNDGEFMYLAYNRNGAAVGGIAQIAMANNSVYGASSTSLAAFNLPSTAWSYTALALYRGLLYAVANDGTTGEIHVFDVSDPTAPVALVTVPLSFYSKVAFDLAIAGRSLFYTGSYGSATSPAPFLFAGQLGPARDGAGAVTTYLGFYSFPAWGGGSPTLVGDTLYLRSNSGLATFDLRPWWRTEKIQGSPSTPTYVNTVGDSATPYGSSEAPLIIDGPWAYLLSQDYRVFDLR